VRARLNLIESGRDLFEVTNEDVFPRSETMYETMAEGYRDELEAIRKEIDLEIGVSKPAVLADPMNVFLLWHVHEIPHGDEDAKLIGVYSTREMAEHARERLVSQPGFRDPPEGFEVSAYRLDQDRWTEGIVSETHEDIVRK
jgi:hypothetical protein